MKRILLQVMIVGLTSMLTPMLAQGNAHVSGSGDNKPPAPRVAPPAPPPPAPAPVPHWQQLRDRFLAANELRKIYTSPPELSGGGKDWGYWYTFSTPPAPSGYTISEFDYELSAHRYFRACHSWGECNLMNKNDSTVTIQWRMQGEENDFGNDIGEWLGRIVKPGTVSGSLTVVVIYRKQPITAQ